MNNKMKKIAVLLGAVLASTSVWAKDTVNIYAASSMTNAVDDLITAYEADHDVDVVPVYGGSSSLARQIERGAPADVFLSANETWVSHLIKNNIVSRDNVTLLAGNQLVLIKPSASEQQPFDVANKQAWLNVLKDSRMAVGNTDAVPVGMYSKEALTHLGVWDTLQPKLAQTNNVRLALALVERGEAPLGMVYKTDAALTDNVAILSTFDPALHSAIHYPLVQITDKDASRAFVDFLKSDKAKAVMEHYGFRTDMGTETFAE
ncbi:MULTISPECIES: molybdate ABC transporter substrate-binding protein [Vibrio]|uniref:molybdate ABC transporter substrate-binding protein n=1 Tax=Vibrio TaxID=662 RepID=UPI000200E2AB|nr:molybdate ABC transporter, periplasmic molybdate-binding protein [Vibrio furnissii NCTC 11218]TRN25136.1 molybdate ABC transporter substrate-binding protein [Vibrio furnissii]